jgi:hypothetical protein
MATRLLREQDVDASSAHAIEGVRLASSSRARANACRASTELQAVSHPQIG